MTAFIPELPAAYEPVVLEEVDDVLAECVRRAEAGAPEGTLVWARAQTDGRGRQGRGWLSPPGGLYAGLLLRPEFAFARVGEVALVALSALGAAVAERVVPMTDLRFGWPNDLLLGGAKVAGLQLRGDSQAGWLALGLCANVEATPEALALAAGSIREEGGVPELTPEELLSGFARHFLTEINRWAEHGLAPLLRPFDARMPEPGTPMALRLADGEQVAGALAGLADDGSLRLSLDDRQRTISIARFFGLPGIEP